LRIFIDLKLVLVGFYESQTLVTTEVFLVHAFELIIGIELVKMLSKHTANSAIEVVVFAIARQIVLSHGNAVDVLLGVIAISALFIVRKYVTSGEVQSISDNSIMNASTTVEELYKRYKIRLTDEVGCTLAGVLSNHAKRHGMKIYPGFKMDVNGVSIEVYTMDANLIKQVKVVT
jgi:hypothetical protein